jgi:SNF2 family DNA or RNA helicase
MRHVNIFSLVNLIDFSCLCSSLQCNVSLVGQWIEEAKSKLKNPGIVYAYHGQNRKRNPLVLAQNAIVVTTYETLASDFRRCRDGECSPCAKVRWWRIICDESHSLRNSNNVKYSAVLNLVGDNKWLVSGTPANTSLIDLLNQLVFLGVEDVDTMFSNFTQNVLFHTKDQGAFKRGRHLHLHPVSVSPCIGHFTFLMRSILLRYSQKQTYRNTSTTLMSLPPKVSAELDSGRLKRGFLTRWHLPLFYPDRTRSPGELLCGRAERVRES